MFYGYILNVKQSTFRITICSRLPLVSSNAVGAVRGVTGLLLSKLRSASGVVRDLGARGRPPLEGVVEFLCFPVCLCYSS